MSLLIDPYSQPSSIESALIKGVLGQRIHVPCPRLSPRRPFKKMDLGDRASIKSQLHLLLCDLREVT